MSYHPNYYEEKESGHRGNCRKRLDLILDNIAIKDPEYTSLTDIGCSEGYYSFGIFEETEINHITAFDKEENLIDVCLETQDEIYYINDASTSVFSFCCMEILDYIERTSGSCDWITDIALYMSVHHHVIQKYGFEAGTLILNILSRMFDQMFFDMGQKNEGCYEYGWWQLLPETDNVKQWLTDYLYENTVYDSIEIIGTSEVHGIDRYFFDMRKSSNEKLQHSEDVLQDKGKQKADTEHKED